MNNSKEIIRKGNIKSIYMRAHVLLKNLTKFLIRDLTSFQDIHLENKELHLTPHSISKVSDPIISALISLHQTTSYLHPPKIYEHLYSSTFLSFKLHLHLPDISN